MRPAPLVGDRIDINDPQSIVVGTYKAGPEFFWEPVVYTTYTRALTYAPRHRRPSSGPRMPNETVVMVRQSTTEN